MTSISNSDWEYTLSDTELQAIDDAIASFSSASPIKKRQRLSSAEGRASTESHPMFRRRLPESLFAFRQRQNTLREGYHFSRNNLCRSFFPEIKFRGHIVYSRTIEEVERAVEHLLMFVEQSKRKEGQCILGLDIEWRPTFQKGVSPRKASVMQICGEDSLCHVLHIIHSQIPNNLRCLLEDPSSLKVGVSIANDATKVFKDHSVSINNLGELSDLANLKLGGHPKKWSLSMLTEMIICRQLPKPGKVRLGNWEVPSLSNEQLAYAATDAYVSWYLYQVLKNLPDPSPEEAVEMLSTSNDKIVGQSL